MTESSKEVAQKKWIEDKIKFYKTVYKSDDRNAKLLAYGDAIEALTAARHKRKRGLSTRYVITAERRPKRR
jgi:hypothetical protein